ncbi:MAG: hypothetical protein AAGJ50_03745 [Pseudomonadota bacterium]
MYDRIKPSKVWHAGPMPIEAELVTQETAERAALEAGDLAEAKRCRIRRDEIKDRQRAAQRVPGKRKRALKQSRNRDPLSRVPELLRRAGEALREHAEGAVIAREGLAVPGEVVDGGTGSDMESQLDRRRYGARAWQAALSAIKDPDFREPTQRVIAERLPLIRAAERAKGHAGGKARERAKQSLVEALGAAAIFFGMVEDLDRGAELDDKKPQ